MAATSSQLYAVSDPDTELMLRVRDDDTDAFAELMERYQDRIVALLYNLLGNYQEAEDLAQEAFLRVYRYRKRYQPTAKFSTWLFRIVHNLASNARRRHRRKPTCQFPQVDSVPVDRPEELWLVDESKSAGSKVANLELCELVRQAVGQLNERQRMALLLHKFEGLSYAEIAEIMDSTVPAIKSLLARARIQLRELLEPYLRSASSVDALKDASRSGTG